MHWKEDFKNNITTVKELQNYIKLSDNEQKRLSNLIENYPMSITKYYLSLINPQDSNDPIKKMCIPSVSEFDLEGLSDTSGESENTKFQGLQHKYKPTVLLLSTSTCAMYCRHCFRKRLVGLNTEETLKMLKDVINYIKQHKEINNILISGGDSFLLSTSIIETFLNELCQIEHIDFIRFGTRTPVVFPQRIYTDEHLLSVLDRYNNKKRIYVVTQFNHINEVTNESMKSIQELQKRNIIVSNQMVLLKGVNDNSKSIVELINSLTRNGIIPYYTFQCRPVKGVATSFQVPLRKGHQIIERAKEELNGHGKRFRYIMSHITGKIEILGSLNKDEMLFKYHQSKDPEKQGELFSYPISEDDCWLFN
ncbi:MAG: KamA family radical SAM protein [Eubacteriales bacterium]